MIIYFGKPSKSVDFIEWVVKTTHIKSNDYMWAVAKIPQIRTNSELSDNY